MQWSSFVGAFAGAVGGLVAAIALFLAWEWLAQRKVARQQPSARPLLERDLEEYVERHFADLFPEWSIHDSSDGNLMRSTKRRESSGRQYRTKAGIIDILCKDAEDNFVVIELKRGKSPDKVIAQVDRYMEWVKRNLARPNQQVRAVIIAQSIDQHLEHILPRRPDIEVHLYDWQLMLNKWGGRK